MISVILCTHNPRPDYLEQALAGLRSQTLSKEQWELVVVDNASNPPLSEAAFDAIVPETRLVREDTIGLTPARLRGIREARGELIFFVDDDNILDADYLQLAQSIGEANPHLGAWGGQSRPRFESDPPEWTRPYWGGLVIRELTGDHWSNVYHLHESMPAGAGLCVRTSVARRYLDLHETGARSMVLDRAGGGLLSGGDTDLACCAIDMGLGAGTFASLGLVHLIPASRLDEPYLLDLVEGFAYSSVVLRSYRPEAYPAEPNRGIRGRIADLLRFATMRGRDRRFHRARIQGLTRAQQDLARKRRAR